MTPGFDFSDADRATLAPQQSEHHIAGRADAPEGRDCFEYPLGSVADGTMTASRPRPLRSRVGQRLIADGPGAATTGVNQGVKWSDGLKLRGYMMDRWRGTSANAAGGRAQCHRARAVEIDGRRVETFVVVEEPVDGAYKLTSQITVARPHLHGTAYVANAKRTDVRAFVSEVTSTMASGSCRSPAEPSIRPGPLRSRSGREGRAPNPSGHRCYLCLRSNPLPM